MIGVATAALMDHRLRVGMFSFVFKILVTCFLKYKESTKKVLVEDNATVRDLKAALLGTPFKKLVTENLLVLESYS